MPSIAGYADPLAELRRLLQLARAYRYVEEADVAYQTAMELAPEIAELKA